MKTLLCLILLISAVFLSCNSNKPSAAPQEVKIGAHGRILDSLTLAPIESVHVTLSAPGFPGQQPDAYTDSNGRYDIWIQDDKSVTDKITGATLFFERTGCDSFAVDRSIPTGYDTLNLIVSGRLSLCNSVNGWELYAWHENNTDYVTLIEGAGSNNTTEMIVSGMGHIGGQCLKKIKITGTSSLHSIIKAVPFGELVACRGTPDSCETPSSEVMDTVFTYCQF